MVVPPLDPAMVRATLRQELRALRLEAADAGSAFPPRLPDPLQRLIANGAVIGLYAPMRGEPDPAALIAGLAKATALPALDRDGAMSFRCWSTGDALVAAPWGGTQPAEAAPVILPDVILVPLLGFDDALNRIGQGRGHYDRYLAAHPAARRIGVAWECQRLDAIAAQPWDIPLDAVVTEGRIYVKDLNRCPTP